MEIRQFDLIIIGAGPAGAACAIRLKDSGLKVAILDKSSFPRDKTCGDALSVDVVNQLAMLADDLAERFENMATKVPAYGVKIFSPKKAHIDIPFIHKGEEKCGYICTRMHFDHFMFEQLEQYPNIQTFEDCEVKSIERRPDGITVTSTSGIFEAPAIIGADGAHSIVSRVLDGPKVDKEHHSAGLRVYYENVSGFHEKNYIELHFFKDILPGYLWIFPLPDNKANIGIGMLSSAVSKKKVNLRETLNRLLKEEPHLAERFKDATPLESIKGFGLPLGSKKREISGDRFLLTGDAAALIDPFSGEGIANAIRSGRVAAEHIMESRKTNNYSAAYNKAYDKEIYRRMWKEFQVSRTLQKLCKSPRLFNFVVKRANQSKRMRNFLIQSLANIEKKKMLTKTIQVYRVFVRKK